MRSDVSLKFQAKKKPPYKVGAIEIGDTFYGVLFGHEGYYLKTFTGLVNLVHPNETWGNDTPLEDVQGYRPVNLVVTEE
jgi:hypothetical protein